MTLSEIVNHLRCSVLKDTASPKLWSDTELVLYVNEAYKDFAIRTHNIVDDETSDYCTFNTVVNTDTYALDKVVLRVDEMGIAEYDGADLTNYTVMASRTRNQLRRSFNHGRPSYFTSQARSHSVRLHPIPDAVYAIEMVVARKPSRDLQNSRDIPEIDEEYHIHLADFAAYRALINNDVDGGNPRAAERFRASYDLAVRDCKRAMARLRLSEPQARNSWTGKRRL